MSIESMSDEVIDLTNSQTFVHNNLPTILSNSIICIDSDDSFSLSPVAERTLKRLVVKDPEKSSKKKQKTVSDQSERNQLKESKTSLGECPICWDQLGTKPLAATICGHVFCIKCIEMSLCAEKRCPMCRKVLKGKLAYHPLYLSR